MASVPRSGRGRRGRLHPDSDLVRAREFWIDLLGLHVTEQSSSSIWLRGYAEAIHHNVVLTEAEQAACTSIGFRVRSEADLDRALDWFGARGCRTLDLPAGSRVGAGRTVRVEDPLGFTLDFVFDMEFLAEWERRCPEAEVHRYPDAGHYVLEDAREQVVPLVASFLDGGSPVADPAT